MDVLLVYPPLSRLERYGSKIGSAGGSQIPLGVFYLAAYLKGLGHRVTVVDGEANGRTAADIAAQVEREKPGLVGISSTTVAFHRALEVARAVKLTMSPPPVVLGGVHVTSCTLEAMSHPEFDFGVLGEGEETLGELVGALADGGGLGSIAGLAHREGGTLKVNPLRERIRDLDYLPFPAYELASDLASYAPPPCNYKMLPVATVITSRGCPNECTFCDNAVFGRSLRQRGALNIAAEIELLARRYGAREIAFVDDTFTVNPRRIRELFRILGEKGLRFPWTCMSRVNTVDRDLLKFMREAGCWHISFGIESGSEEILRRIRKNISLAAVREVIRWCSELGILTKGFFIIGHPGETRETIRSTIELGLELPLDDIVVTLNTPVPGSVQHREAARHGTLQRTDWAEFNYWRPVFVPRGLSEEILLDAQREFYRRFYLRPRIMVRYALSLLSRSGPKRLRALAGSLPFLYRGGGRGR